MTFETPHMNIDRDSVKLLRDKINAALAPLAAELGVEIRTANATFNPGPEGNVKFNLLVMNKTATGVLSSPDALAFKRNAFLLGFKAEDLGAQFSVAGKRYTIVGAKPRSGKYPILTRNDAGQIYKFPSRTVQLALGRPVTTSDFGVNVA